MSFMDSTHEIVYECSRFHPGPIIKQNSVDRLSNLPIDILFHILSFLDITEVVRTRLLSRKWRYTWTLVPYLNFDFNDFWHQLMSVYQNLLGVNREMSVYQNLLGVNSGDCLLKFWDFVKWTLFTRYVFPVRVKILCDRFHVGGLDMLLCLCAMRNVQELELCTGFYFFFQYRFFNPPCLYSSSFIKSVLELAPNFSAPFKLQSYTVFGNLKSLRLVKVLFHHAHFTETLFNDCGVLENLSMENCHFLVMNVLKISALKLRKFTFVNLHNGSSRYIDEFHFKGGLKVHAPHLQSFCYDGPELCSWEFQNVSCLNRAFIQMECEIYENVQYSVLGPMVSCLAHAKELSLSAAFVLYFSPSYGGLRRNIIPFHYLRFLKLEMICDSGCMEGLINFLKLSPNLEVLCIRFEKFLDTVPWVFCEDNVAILLLHLKEIEITEFHDSVFLLEFIKFFLRTGKSLEKIEITQRKRKLNLKKLYALQADNIASKAVHVSLISFSDSGQKELLQFVYRKCRVAVWKLIPKWKIKSNIRYMKMSSAGSSLWFLSQKFSGSHCNVVQFHNLRFLKLEMICDA